MPLITRDMTIGALLEAHPHTITILRGAGVHCIGCAIAPRESIEEGLRHHGHSEARIDSIIERLNEAAHHPHAVDEKVLEGVSITIEAAQRFGAVIRERKKNGCSMRISANHSGYRFAIDDTTRRDDQALTIAGTQFLIDSDSRMHLSGVSIDYSDGSFRIER
jgi:hybrid cluster-associated redox disulfide protein